MANEEEDPFAWLDKRPWYERWYSNFSLRKMILDNSVRNKFSKRPENLKTRNDVCLHILDDLEFDYDADMIYGKIISGSYGNTPIDPKKRTIMQRIKKLFGYEKEV